MDDQRIGPNFFEWIGKGLAQADAKSSASGNSTRQIQLGQIANEIAGFHDSDRKQANVLCDAEGARSALAFAQLTTEQGSALHDETGGQSSLLRVGFELDDSHGG